MTGTHTSPPPEWPDARVAELLGKVELTTGHHSNGVEACAMDLIGMAMQGEWTDTPGCVHPILARAVHRINDYRHTSPADRRALVLDAGPHLIGTSDKTRTPWAVLVAHRGGLTVAGLVAALTTTPPVADLTWADLTRADLAGAVLTWADLTGADLTGADLTGANLFEANLTRADLTGANLTGADLFGADLTGANLFGADLFGADLTGADLTEANLTGAARLDKAIGVPAAVLEAWRAEIEADL